FVGTDPLEPDPTGQKFCEDIGNVLDLGLVVRPVVVHELERQFLAGDPQGQARRNDHVDSCSELPPFDPCDRDVEVLSVRPNDLVDRKAGVSGALGGLATRQTAADRVADDHAQHETRRGCQSGGSDLRPDEASIGHDQVVVRRSHPGRGQNPDHQFRRGHRHPNCFVRSQRSVTAYLLRRASGYRIVRSRTMRPYIRTISSARTWPSRTVRMRVRMWCTTARSFPRSTISPTSNSSSGAARTSCGTVRFPLLTENFTRTWSIRFAQSVATSRAFAPSTRRPPASIAVIEMRESPRSSASPTWTSSSGENSSDDFSDLSSHDTTSGTSIGFGSRVTTDDRKPHAEHLTTPSNTISSPPPILPRSTRCGATLPHCPHVRTRALGADITRSNAPSEKGFAVLGPRGSPSPSG